MIPRPTKDNIVVQEHALKEVSDGGILLPDTQRDASLRTGTVVATGPGHMYPDHSLSRMDMAEGDTVYFHSFTGVEIKYDNVSYLVMSQKQVVAVESQD